MTKFVLIFPLRLTIKMVERKYLLQLKSRSAKSWERKVSNFDTLAVAFTIQDMTVTLIGEKVIVLSNEVIIGQLIRLF